jgi:hypothetical protein
MLMFEVGGGVLEKLVVSLDLWNSLSMDREMPLSGIEALLLNHLPITILTATCPFIGCGGVIS